MADGKILIFRFLCFVCAVGQTCLLLFSVSTYAREHTTIRMCYEEQELEPYFMGKGPNPPEVNPGVFIEMMYQLEKQIPGVRIALHRVPWKRCLNELKQNVSDLVIASYENEREKIGVYPSADGVVDKTLSISTSQYCLFTKRHSKLAWNGLGFSKIPEKPVAVPQGYSVITLLQQHQLPWVNTNSSIAAMDLLSKSVVSAAVTYCEAGANYLYRNADKKVGIIAQSPPLNSRQGFLLFSKAFWQKNPDLVRQIWQDVAIIRDKEFPRLLDKYEELRFSN